MNILSSSFYQRNTVVVAKELIGKLLVRQLKDRLLVGMITETEAYKSDDPACHAYNGKTKRNAALFGPVGHAYVYFTYGCHFCVNIVAKDVQTPAGGVLIRAIKPLQGIEIMQQARGKVPLKNLANGPGKVTQALQIGRDLYGISVVQSGELYVAESTEKFSGAIQETPRIGISKATDNLWRFIVVNQ